MTATQLSENASNVTHAPMFNALSILYPEYIAGRESKRATRRGNSKVGSAMCANVDEARRHHVVGGRCRFNRDSEVWNASKPCGKKADGDLFV